MNLADCLKEDCVLPELSSCNKGEVLAELVSVVCAAYPALDRPGVLAVLQERERLGSTGLGDGVAMPHGKLGCCGGAILAVGRSSRGIDFDAPDLIPCRIFFCSLRRKASAADTWGTSGTWPGLSGQRPFGIIFSPRRIARPCGNS